MKIDITDGEIMIYVKKNYIEDIDFTDKDSLEEYFRELITKLKDNYNIQIFGFYDIYVYSDPYYGIVLKLIHEDLDYYIGNNQLEMKIILIPSTFLYLVEDYFDFDMDKYELYIYSSSFYLKPNNYIDIDLLEKSILIYENTDLITKYGRKLVFKKKSFNIDLKMI